MPSALSLGLGFGLPRRGYSTPSVPTPLAVFGPSLKGWWKADKGVNHVGAFHPSTISSYYSTPVFLGNTITTFSVASWVYLNADQTMRVWFSNYDGVNGWAVGISDVTSNQVKFYLGGGQHAYQTGTLTVSTWHHVVVTYDDATHIWQIYIDGVLNNSGTNVINFGSGQTFQYVGNLDGGMGNQTVNANIGPIAVWSRVVTGAEVTALYAGGNGLAYSQMSAGIKTGMLACWEMMGAATFPDLTANSHTLTVSGSNDILPGPFEVVPQNNDLVTWWVDQIGGYILGQSTTSRQAVFKTNVANGLPGVLGDGSDDFYVRVGNAVTTMGASNFNNTGTICCVFNIQEAAGSQNGYTPVGFGSHSVACVSLTGGAPAEMGVSRPGDYAPILSLPYTPFTTVAFVLTWDHQGWAGDGTAMSTYINGPGGTIGNTLTGDSGSFGQQFNGTDGLMLLRHYSENGGDGYSHMHGYEHEFCVLNRKINSAEALYWMQYAHSRWGS